MDHPEVEAVPDATYGADSPAKETPPDSPEPEAGGMATMIVAVFVLVIIFAGLAWPLVGKWYRRRQEKGVMDVLSSNPFIRFRVEPIRQRFFEACRQHPPGSLELKRALVHRAVAVIPMIERLTKEGDGIWRLYRRGMCSEGLFRSFKTTEDMIHEEMQEVRVAAEALVPNWGRTIWAEAMQHHRKLVEHRAAQEAKANRQADLNRNAKLEKKKKKAEAQATLQRNQKAERDAEKAAQQLRREEEQKEKTAKKSSKKTKKKKR